MTYGRFARTRELFEKARDLAPNERASFLDEACENDRAIRREVEALLDAHEEGGTITLGGEGDSPKKTEAWNALIDQLRERGPGHSRYVFEGELARGGMGVIHRVFDRDARRRLALKVMLGSGAAPASGDTPDVADASLGRFLEEAQVTSQLDHPGIVPVHEIGVDETEQVYFTMKLVKGDDLRTVFDRVADPNDDEWTTTRALNVMLRVCEAMAYAHTKGVIHRDLKPGNVMVGKFGEAYVMDWGLAKVLGQEDAHDLRFKFDSTSIMKTDRKDAAAEAPDTPLLTMDGDVVGTPAYMPPEQAEGRTELLGPPADVYAVGAMLYHLVAGHMPYVKPGAKVSARTILGLVLNGPPASLTEKVRATPTELIAIVEKAMAREIVDRYSDMTALARDLRAFLENRVVAAYEAGAWAELRKWVARNRVLTSTAVGSLIIVAALGIWSNFTIRGERAVAQSERDRADEHADQAKRRAEEAADQRDRALAAEKDARKSAYRSAYRAALVALGVGNHAEALLLLPAQKPGDPDRGFIDRRVDRTLATWKTHEGGVRVVAWSPNGERLLTCGDDGAVRVWDAATHERVHQLTDDASPALSVAWSLDGRRIASGDEDGGVRIWSASGEELDRHDVGPSALDWIALDREDAIWSSDALGTIRHTSMDGTTRICGLRTGLSRWPTVLETARSRLWFARDETLHALGANAADSRVDFVGTEATTAIDVVDSGSVIVTGGEGGILRVFDQTNGALIRSWRSGSEDVDALAGHPRDGTFAAARGDAIEIWDAVSGHAPLGQFVGHTDRVRALAFRPDGKTLAAALGDGTVRLWSTSTARHPRLALGIDRVDSAAFSPDGHFLACGGTIDRIEAHVILVVNTQTGAEIWREQTAGDVVEEVAFTPNGDWLASATRAGAVSVHEATAGTRQFTRSTGSPPSGLAFTADGKSLLVGTDTELLQIEAESGAVTWKYLATGPVVVEDSGAVWARDPRRKAPIRIDVLSHRSDLRLRETSTELRGLTVSRDGSRLVTLDAAGRLDVRNVANDTIERRIPLRVSDLRPALVGAEGQLVVERAGRASVMDLETGETSFTWEVLLGPTLGNDILLFDRTFRRAFTAGISGAEVWHSSGSEAHALLESLDQRRRASAFVDPLLIAQGPQAARETIHAATDLSHEDRQAALERIGRSSIPVSRQWVLSAWKRLDPDDEIDVAGGLRDARQAVLWAPSHAEPRRILAWALALNGEMQQAKSQATIAVRLAPGSRSDRFLVAIAAMTGLEKVLLTEEVVRPIRDEQELLMTQENHESVLMRVERLLADGIRLFHLPNGLQPKVYYDESDRKRGWYRPRFTTEQRMLRAALSLEAAATLLGRGASRPPVATTVAAWVGIARARMGHDEDAIDALNTALSDDDRLTELDRARVDAHIALCLARTGKREEAEAIRTKLKHSRFGDDETLADALSLLGEVMSRSK